MKDQTRSIIAGTWSATGPAAVVLLAVCAIRLFFFGGTKDPIPVAARTSSAEAHSSDADPLPGTDTAGSDPLPSQAPAWSEAEQHVRPEATAPEEGARDESEGPPVTLSYGTRWDRPGNEPALARFAEWVARYRGARSSEERAALLAEGRQLAEERQAAMKNLIRHAPELALQLAVPFGVQRELPDSIVVWLEKTISDRGTLAVMAALPEPGREREVIPVWRTATLGGQDYEAHVYGWRLGEPTRRDVPLNGIVLGRLLAVSAHVVRILDPVEASARATSPSSATEPVCAVSGQPVSARPAAITVEAGGRFFRVCGVDHAADLDARLVRIEAADGEPARGDVGGSDPGEAVPQASAFTEGIKRLLVIRVDFTDLPGEPVGAEAVTNLVAALDGFYRDMSGDRTGFDWVGRGSAMTPTLRLGLAAGYYGTNDLYVALQNDARAAARAAGYDAGDYDFDLICFGPVPGWGWSGLGWVGAPGVWLRNRFTPGLAAHELGHNFGLNHANYWDTQGRSVIGTNGTSVEYGDLFDTMGLAVAGPNHFNVRYKSYLNWLPPSAVQTVTTSGVYRVHAHDARGAAGLRALRIPRDRRTNYWVEFRQEFVGNPWMMNGVGLRWAENGNQHSHLLDTTPGSADGRNDSALVLGRTFSDPAAGIHITALGKAGGTPEAIDVAVVLGTFPGNRPPEIAVAAGATRVWPGDRVAFAANARDPDGDPIACHWDFGDGTCGTNGLVAEHTWADAGEYRVRCTVSDLKGGVAAGSVIVTVGAPETYWISGKVTAGGEPLPGVRVSVSAGRVTWTDSDGTYALVGLPAGSYRVEVFAEPYTFPALGSGDWVTVGPSVAGMDFAAVAVKRLPADPGPSLASAARGVYNGLFHETEEVRPGRAGFFSFALTAKGAYSAALLTRGWKLPAKGMLDSGGRATNVVPAPDGRRYTVTWAVALDGTDQISGTVDGGDWLARLAGDRLVYDARTNAARQAGRYTLLLPGNPAQTETPGGDSFGLAVVDARGTARLSGYLADNTRLVVRSSLSRLGQWPVYASLSGREGMVLGWLTFRSEAATDVDGVLSWTRPVMAAATFYPAGFATELESIGSRFAVPGPGEPVVEWDEPWVQLAGGDLPAPITEPLHGGGPKLAGVESSQVRLKIASSSGLFSGSVRLSGAAGSRSFRGVVLQKAGLGGGYFAGTNTTGQVKLE